MIARLGIAALALSIVACGAGQSGTEGEPVAPESPFHITTDAGEQLMRGDGWVHVFHREDGPPQAEVAITGWDASNATWSLVLESERDRLVGTYTASVTSGPTAPGVATLARREDPSGAVTFGESGTVSLEVTAAGTGFEMSGEVDAVELGFRFEGPILFSCTVPFELLPTAPPPPIPEGVTDTAKLPVEDTSFETEFCRDFMGTE